MTFYQGQSSNLSDISDDTIDDYILWLQEETELKLVTINNKIRDLRAFMNFCFKKNYIPKKLEIKLLRIDEPLITPFTPEQLDEIYDACLSGTKGLFYKGKEMVRYRDYVLMRMLEETGMRIGEVLRLNIYDVDLKRKTIQIKKAKNGKSRVTYITTALHKELKKYLEIRQDFLYDKNLAATSFFINKDGGRLTHSTVQDRITDYGKLAGITNVRCSPHTFRHTFAKNYLLNGGDIFTLKDILGHRTLEMTYRYARLFGIEQQKQYIKVMEKYSKSKRK
jgi:integrase/recombinase XerD